MADVFRFNCSSGSTVDPEFEFDMDDEFVVDVNYTPFYESISMTFPDVIRLTSLVEDELDLLAEKG